MSNQKKPFSERHPKINFLLGVILLLLLIAIALIIITYIFKLIGNGFTFLVDYLENFVNTTDQVIIVALITGGLSVLGVVISSIIAKIVEYKYNIKKYLYDKREVPYEQFIDMVYKIMEDTKKQPKDRMTEEEMRTLVSEFSKGLTLWGSNRVAKKWIKYRTQSVAGDPNVLFLLEDIIYEMRRDVGLRRKMKKGEILSFFINDVDKALQNKI